MSKIIRPTPKQREAYIACESNRITLYGGAIRGGKSYFLVLYAFTLAFKYPKSRWLFLRESLPTMKRTLLVTFNNFLNDGFSQYIQSFNQQDLTVTLTNGSQFIFMAESYDTDKDLNRFRGLEINGAFIDEANEIQEVTFDKVIERSGSWFHSIGCPTKIVMTANPSNNWLKERIYDKYKNGQLPDGIAYVPARIFDNPYIPQDYLESLKMLPRFQYEVFVEGNWDLQLKQGGEFYKCFELDKHVSVTKYNPALTLHISFDENVNPYLPCAVYQIDGTKIYQIDEILGYNPNNTIKWVCSEIKRRYSGHKSGLIIYGDATSQKADVKIEKGHNFFTLIRAELAQFNPNLRVYAANPSLKMRGNFINQVLFNNFDDISITIGEHCKTTINDFIGTKEAADGTKNKETEVDPKTKVRYQKYGHLTDCFDYMITSAFSSSYLKYQRGGFIPFPSVGKNLPSKHGY